MKTSSPQGKASHTDQQVTRRQFYYGDLPSGAGHPRNPRHRLRGRVVHGGGQGEDGGRKCGGEKGKSRRGRCSSSCWLWNIIFINQPQLPLLLLSLLSKAWGMSFFVIALILDWYPLRRLPPGPRDWFKPPARRVFLQKAPYALLGIAFALQAARAASSVSRSTACSTRSTSSRS